MRAQELLVVAGVSGSGKSTALSALEDLGYFCVDNLPAPMIPGFVDFLTSDSPREKFAGESGRYALLLDIQDQTSVQTVKNGLDLLRGRGLKAQILYFDASDEILLKRFREARRPHPLLVKRDGSAATLNEAIQEERQILSTLRAEADFLIDSSAYSVHDLKGFITEYVGGRWELLIVLESFGYKFGLPTDADLVMDVRFLPNPHFVPELRPLTGLEAPVRDYIYRSGEAVDFVQRYFSLLEFLIPKYIAEKKRYLTVALGCTGGKHRSTALSEDLAQRLQALGQKVIVRHRDLGRE